MEEIIVIALCLSLNALFAAYEMAFVSVPRQELRKLARKGHPSAKKILNLRENPERTLSIIQIGISLVGAISAAVGGAGATEFIVPYLQKSYGLSEIKAESIAILSVVLPLTYLSVVVGELVPKSIALKNPVKITLFGARALFIADRILSPAVSALEWSTKQLLRIIYPRSSQVKPPAESNLEIDNLPQHHQDAILNLAHIEQRKLGSILLPWKDVIHVKVTDTVNEVAQVIFASGHTRLPILAENQILGILHTKEFLALREAGFTDWKAAIRPAPTVSMTRSVLSTLRLLQEKKSHLAIVVGSRGEQMGIVTFEDISEEIWGDIFDEDDESRIQKVFADRVKLKPRPPEP
jgi:putative hemolysin